MVPPVVLVPPVVESVVLPDESGYTFEVPDWVAANGIKRVSIFIFLDVNDNGLFKNYKYIYNI